MVHECTDGKSVLGNKTRIVFDNVTTKKKSMKYNKNNIEMIKLTCNCQTKQMVV